MVQYSIPFARAHKHITISRFKGIAPFRIDRSWRPWLLDTGSLTQRLWLASGGDFRVNILSTGHGAGQIAEQRLLRLPPRTLPFIREVELMGNGVAWVYARTVIPRSTELGAGRYLTRLGTKPLGAALFSDARVRRGDIWLRHQGIKHPAATGPVWGRQSLFFIDQAPLLVSEYFLPTGPFDRQIPDTKR